MNFLASRWNVLSGFHILPHQSLDNPGYFLLKGLPPEQSRSELIRCNAQVYSYKLFFILCQRSNFQKSYLDYHKKIGSCARCVNIYNHKIRTCTSASIMTNDLEQLRQILSFLTSELDINSSGCPQKPNQIQNQWQTLKNWYRAYVLCHWGTMVYFIWLNIVLFCEKMQITERHWKCRLDWLSWLHSCHRVWKLKTHNILSSVI